MLLALHIHSRHSFDSAVSVGKLIRRALRHRIDALAITDHDTMEGSLEAAALAGGQPLQIIPGAEYCTDCGDIIGLFLAREVKSRRAPDAVREIRDQGGVSILPHPYHGHRDVEELAAMVDAVEVFNGRCTAEQNQAAEELAARHGKPRTAGADAHFCRELGNAVMNLECSGPLTREEFLHAPRSWAARPNWPGSLQLSQMVKGWKQRDFRLLRGQFRPLAKNLVKSAAGWL